MQRYVALVTQGQGCWIVRFPELPGTETMGFPLHVALWRAQREMGMRATVLKSLGAAMPAPISVAELVSEPGYKEALPYIIAVPGPKKAPGGSAAQREVRPRHGGRPD